MGSIFAPVDMAGKHCASLQTAEQEIGMNPRKICIPFPRGQATAAEFIPANNDLPSPLEEKRFGRDLQIQSKTVVYATDCIISLR